MKYKGICVGGPHGGKWMEQDGREFRAVILGSVPLPPLSGAYAETTEFRYFSYAWREFAGPKSGCWVSREWDPEDFVLELLGSYHPVV